MISVYIAISLDGMIAGEADDMDWLYEYNYILDPESNSYFATRYEEYFKSVDNVVLGSKTYEIILKDSSEYPYKSKNNYVITTVKTRKDPNITQFLTLEEFAKLDLPNKTWIVGGSQIINQMLNLKLIDEIIITIMPIVLGRGTPLFQHSIMTKFKCEKVMMENGIVELSYKVK